MQDLDVGGIKKTFKNLSDNALLTKRFIMQSDDPRVSGKLTTVDIDDMIGDLRKSKTKEQLQKTAMTYSGKVAGALRYLQKRESVRRLRLIIREQVRRALKTL